MLQGYLDELTEKSPDQRALRSTSFNSSSHLKFYFRKKEVPPPPPPVSPKEEAEIKELLKQEGLSPEDSKPEEVTSNETDMLLNPISQNKASVKPDEQTLRAAATGQTQNTESKPKLESTSIQLEAIGAHSELPPLVRELSRR
jgi:hypothetical protein